MTSHRTHVLFVICLLWSAEAIILLEPLEIELDTPNSWAAGPRTFNITATIVLSDPISACTAIKNPDEITGSIVFVTGDICNYESQARNVQSAGGLGLIVHELTTSEAGINYNGYNEEDRDDINIPIVYINGIDGTLLRELISNSSRVIGIMASGDRNAWAIINTSAALIAFVVVHGAIDLFIGIFAIYKLIWYFKNKKTIISVAQMSLTLIIIGVSLGIILRIMLIVSGYGVSSISTALVLGAAFVPLTLLLLSALIVSFYWFELTSKVSTISRAWSKKLWVPFLVGCGILVVLLVILLLWTRYFRVVILLVIIFIVYALITLAVALIWIIFGAKLRRALMRDHSKVGESNTRRYRRLIALMILCACFLIILCGTIGLATIVGFNSTSTRAIFETAQFAIEGAAMVMVFLFSTRKRESKSTSRSSHSLGAQNTPRSQPTKELISSQTGEETKLSSAEEPELQTFNSPRYRWLGPPQWEFDITGQIVFANSTDVANKILLFSGRMEAGTELDLVEFAKLNVSGVVVLAGSSPSLLNYVWDGLHHSSVLLPVVQVSLVVYPILEDLILNNENVTIRFTASDVNQWALAFESGWMIFYSVFLSILAVACMGMALYKYIMFVRSKGFQTSITQLMLIFEFIANSPVDPLQSRTIFTYFATQMFYTISWPFLIINLLLVSFYWRELMRKSNIKINRFLKKLLIPFWVIFAILLAGELASGVLRGLQFNTRIVVLVLGIAYISIALACIIFFLITGHKLAKNLRRIAKKTTSPRRKRLSRTALYVYISTGGVLLWLMCLISGGLTDVFWYPWGFYSVWFITFFSLSFISLMHMQALHVPSEKGAQSATSRTEQITKSGIRSQVARDKSVLNDLSQSDGVATTDNHASSPSRGARDSTPLQVSSIQ